MSNINERRRGVRQVILAEEKISARSKLYCAQFALRKVHSVSKYGQTLSALSFNEAKWQAHSRWRNYPKAKLFEHIAHGTRTVLAAF